jgi:hypothetical protein
VRVYLGRLGRLRGLGRLGRMGRMGGLARMRRLGVAIFLKKVFKFLAIEKKLLTCDHNLTTKNIKL